LMQTVGARRFARGRARYRHSRFPNVPNPDLSDWSHAHHGANYERLTRVKATYDPDSVFRFQQSLPPATKVAPAERE
jgi:FAD/FMN-containing dehydrogenase